MSVQSFKNYEVLALNRELINTEVDGRYLFQEAAERLIIKDVVHKLDIEATDSVLDIGCGTGSLLIPLSFMVEKVSGVDNKESIQRLEGRACISNKIKLYKGDFMSASLRNEKYEKIIIYSVLQYLDSEDSVIDFVMKALTHLKPGGKILLGDIPNADKKNRFLNSPSGKIFSKDWELTLSNNKPHPVASLISDRRMVTFTDGLIFKLMTCVRDMGFESHLLPQPVNLPFGNTREDILISAIR